MAVGAPETTVDDPPTERSSLLVRVTRWRPPTWLVVAGVMAAPFAVMAVRMMRGVDPVPTGDVSLMEIRTRDVFTAHNPTLGSYGRYGFNHPGPLWFYALAIPYRLTGQLQLGALLAGVCSIVAILWVASRHDRLWWTAALTALLVWGAGGAFLSDPWEPHGLLLPGVSLLLLTFDTVAGRPWSLPLVAGVASLLGAAQATLLPFAIAMGLTALWGARRHLVPILVSAALLLVLWSPTIWQQWTGDPTNITQMREAPGEHDGEGLGTADAWRAVSMELGHRATWFGAPLARERFSGEINLGAAPLIPIGAVALVVALARRRTAILVVAAIATVAAVVAMSQLLGPVFVWIPQWLRTIGFGCWLAAGWALARRVPVPVLAGAVAVLTVLSTWDAATFDGPDDRLGPAIRQLVHELPPLGDDAVLVSSTVSGSVAFGSGFDGLDVLVLELEKRGEETVVDPRLAHRYGPRRAEKKRADEREVILVMADRNDKPPDFISIGVVDPLPPHLREERLRLLAELGVPVDASPRRILRVVWGEPERQRLADRLLEIGDPPRLELMVSPALR